MMNFNFENNMRKHIAGENLRDVPFEIVGVLKVRNGQ